MEYKRFKIVAEIEVTNDINLTRNLINAIEEKLGVRVVTINLKKLNTGQEKTK